jgi:hypothetical protein
MTAKKHCVRSKKPDSYSVAIMEKCPFFSGEQQNHFLS